ncbi:MAG TPA: CBS domain-containing protein [Terriglobales bacterium]|nr:CBS domain-containing protein [Terriglobales bacterium]
MKVSDLMTTEVETVRMDSTLEEVASIMKVDNIGAVPVVDEDDDLVGIITDRDIVVRCIADGKNPAETNVEEVLTHELETIEPDADIEEAARLMADKQIRRLPVCEDGDLVGMLSIGDLAVKSPQVEASGDALREISHGVKGESAATPMPRTRSARMVQMNASAHEGGSRAAYAAAANFNDDEDVDLEFSDEKDLAMSDVRERHANRHHQASQEVKGSGNTKKKLHPISQGRPQQNLGVLGQKKQGQGITNKQAEEELKRNNRVVAIRDDAQAGRRRKQRKTG